MSIGDINKTSSPLTAGEWHSLLEKAQSQGKTVGHHYIVFDGTKYDTVPGKTGKMSVADIVKTSQEKLADLQKSLNEDLDKQGYLTDEQVKKFSSVSSDIATYTEAIIKAREEKRGLTKIQRGIALVLCCLASPLLGISAYFGYKIWQGGNKFEQEIADLKKNVFAMRQDIQKMENRQQKFNILQKDLGYSLELAGKIFSLEDNTLQEQIDRMLQLKNQIKELNSKNPSAKVNNAELQALKNELAKIQQDVKLYIGDIQEMEKKLNIPFDKAAKYIHLLQPFVKEQMPYLNSTKYASKVGQVVNGTIDDQLNSYYKLDPKKRPAMLDQFVKDMTRGNTFKRVDVSNPKAINDKVPLPQPTESATQLKDASKAISDLVVHERDKDWEPVLQLAVAQTNLNGAFFLARSELAVLGAEMFWQQNGKNYSLMPEFPESELPPANLEIIRDKDGAIQQVKVSIEGSLDLIKARKDANPENEAPTTAITGAVQIKLDYTITLGPDKKPVLSNVKTLSTTNIPSMGSSPKVIVPNQSAAAQAA